mmetsp:Transcript_45096/g.71295  ORF Transcript_45096/g.71295 Transcript_45096/m.71295 type:complete len:87 (-) Transcript_45096:203-463(-)
MSKLVLKPLWTKEQTILFSKGFTLTAQDTLTQASAEGRTHWQDRCADRSAAAKGTVGATSFMSITHPKVKSGISSRSFQFEMSSSV